jgi:hypothetical protein
LERPSLQQLKKDPFLANIDWSKIEKEEVASPYIPQFNSIISWEGKLPSLVYLQNK